MPGSGKHNVNSIDSFFKVRPSRTTIREGETISFLENGNLVKQEKRNGVVYETVYAEQGSKKEKSQRTIVSSGASSSGDITSVTAGAGLTGGGLAGPVTLDVVGGTGITANANDIAIDSTVATLTGTQTLSNKTLASPTFTGDIAFNDASTPVFTIKDTTNNVQADWRATDTLSAIGTTTDNAFYLKQNGVFQVTINSNQIILNSSGEDRNTIIKDDSGTAVFKVDAGTSTTEIGTLSVTGNATITGDLTVQGDTTTLNTATLQVEDKNIVLNYHATNDTSGSADGAGITIQDAVNSTTDATMLWDATNDEFDFSHTVTAPSFTGDLTGNADTATKWASGVNINLSGNVVGSTGTVLDGSGDVTIGATIQTDAVTFGMLNDNIISGQNPLTVGLADTDELLLSDAGVLKKVDISVLESKFISGIDALTLANFDSDVVIIDSEVGSVIRNDARFLTASATESVIESYGYTTNTGTVTSVAVSGGNGLTSSGGPITTSGTITLAVGAGTGIATNANDIELDINSLGSSPQVVLNGSEEFAVWDPDYLTSSGQTSKLTLDDVSGYVQAINFTGTNDGVMTKNPNGTLTAESSLTFDGSSLNVTGSSRVTGNAGLFQLVGTDHAYIEYFPDGTGAGRKAYVGFGSSGNDIFTIANESSDQDIYIKVKDGTSTLTALSIDASNVGAVKLPNDNQILYIGEGLDLRLRHDSSNSFISNVTGSFFIESLSHGGKLQFATEDSLGVKEYVLNITGDDHRVGIGATSPSTKLEIKDTTPVLRLTDSSSGVIDTAIGTIEFYSEDTSGNYPAVGASIKAMTESSFGSGHGLAFLTNADSASPTERMRIDEQGNVGIGVTSPGEKLEVNGSIALSNNTYFKARNSVGTLVPLFRLNSSNHIEIINGNSTNGDIIFKDASDTNMTIKGDTGNVGIGTITPSQKLDIRDGQLTFTHSSLNQALSGRIRFNEYSNEDNISGAYIQYNGASNYLQMFTNTETTDYEFLRALRGSHLALQPSGGNVGIGTVSPTYELDVEGNIGMNAVLYHNGDDNTYLKFDTDRVRMAAGGETLLDLYEDGTQDYVKLGDGGDVDINLNDDMFVEGSSSNIGIGTVSPGAKLDIDVAGSNGGMRVISSSDSKIAHFRLAGGSRELLQIGGESDSVSKVQIGTSATSAPAITIDSSDNVGIGTTTPASALHIVAAGLTDSIITSNTESDATTKYGTYLGSHYTNSEEPVAGMLITSGSASATGNLVTIGGGVSAANAANIIRFFTAPNKTTLTGTEKMRIDNSGNIGINEGSRLYLDGTALTGNTYIVSPASDAIDILAGNNKVATLTSTYFEVSPGTEDIDFIVDDSSGVEAFRVDSGTGNTTIANDLTVSGTFALSTLNVTTIKNNDSPADTAMTIDSNGRVTFSGGPTISSGGINVTGASTMGAISMSGGNLSNVADITLTSKLYLDGGGNTYIFEESPDNVIHYVGGQNKLRFNSTGTILNDAGLALDFRVEGDTDPNLLFVDGSADKVGIGTNAPLEELDIAGSLKVRGDSSVATEVLELGQFVSPNVNTPQYTFNTYDAAGGLPSMGDHLEIRSVRWGQSISFSRNGQGGAVPTALFYNASDTGYMDLYRALNPTADATNQVNVRLHVNGNSFLRGGALTIGDVSPLTVGGTPRLSLQGAGLNIGANANDLSYIRRIDTGDYQWQTWNGNNDGQIHLQPYGGSVGIGTTSPSNKLEAFGTDAGLVVHYQSNSRGGIHALSTQRIALATTASADDIVFGYGGSPVTSAGFVERMRIDNSTGNVGIGTTLPAETLHLVNGSGASQLRMGRSGDSTYLEMGAGTNYAVFNVENNATNAYDFQDGGTSRLMINASGNVGIGTVSPQSKLNINVAAESAIPSAGNDTTFLMIGNDGSGTTNYGTMIGTLNTGNGYIQQQRFDGTATTYNLLLQPNGGNVGIGTTNPGNKLEVRGDIAVAISDTQDIIKLSDAGNDGSIELYTGEATPVLRTKLTAYGDSYFGNSNAQLGIGTASPGYKLDVNGNGRFVADLRCEGRYLSQNGSQSAPSYSFYSQGNAGMYRYGTGIGFSAGGTERVRIEEDKLFITGAGVNTFRIQFPNDQRIYDNGGGGLRVGAASYALELYSGGTSPISFITGGISGTEKMRIDSSGNVLIGASSNRTTVSGYSPRLNTEGAGAAGYIQIVDTENSQFHGGTLALHKYRSGGIVANTELGSIWFGGTDSANSTFAQGALIRAYAEGADSGSNVATNVRFFTNTGSAVTEAMRIESDQDVHFDQDVIAFSTTPSDKRLKKNFTKIDNGLDVVSKLEGHTFNWKKGGDRLSAGFKAQEVEKILPHLVDEKKLPLRANDDKEYKILRYEEMIPYLVEAIKEQQEQINKLEEKLNG